MLAIGLDIAKGKLDFYCAGKHCEIKNHPKSIKEHFKSIDRQSRIVLESTGKHHRATHRVLERMGFSVMVVNPYQSKHFAMALKLNYKTDKADAKMLSIFAEKMDFKPTPCASKLQQSMQDLSRHLDDLKKVRLDLNARTKDSTGFIKRSLGKAVKAIDKEIKAAEEKLSEAIDKDDTLQKSLQLLMSIPGVGETTAVSLLSYLKELGSVNKRQIAALSGLAPMNNDSGKFEGKRRIKGGRHDVRSHLYMPVLGAATQHNKRLNSFYVRLVKSGKPKKVALTACMRKLITWANAIIATGEPWDNKYANNH